MRDRAQTRMWPPGLDRWRLHPLLESRAVAHGSACTRAARRPHRRRAVGEGARAHLCQRCARGAALVAPVAGGLRCRRHLLLLALLPVRGLVLVQGKGGRRLGPAAMNVMDIMVWNVMLAAASPACARAGPRAGQRGEAPWPCSHACHVGVWMVCTRCRGQKVAAAATPPPSPHSLVAWSHEGVRGVEAGPACFQGCVAHWRFARSPCPPTQRVAPTQAGRGRSNHSALQEPMAATGCAYPPTAPGS